MVTNEMIASMESAFAGIKAKLDLNGDGKLDIKDVGVAATAVGAEIWHIVCSIVHHAEPALPGLMMAAVAAAAGSTGDKRKAALKGVEQALIATGKTAIADTALDETSRIGQMVGLSGNTVDQLRIGAVALLKKNDLAPSGQ